MKGSDFASNICAFTPKLTVFAKNSLQRRSFYQIKHQMHSCDTTIFLENAYFTTSNFLTKYLCVASMSSYSTSSLNIRKLAKFGKKINFGSDIYISDVIMNPFNTFGPDIFTYLKHIGVQIKEKINGKIASGFLFFLQIQGQKSQFMNLALYFPCES